jgi:hypothetical protein
MHCYCSVDGISGISHEFYDMTCEDTFRHSWNVLPVAASAGSDGTGGIKGSRGKRCDRGVPFAAACAQHRQVPAYCLDTSMPVAPEEKDTRTFDINRLEASDIHNTHQQTLDQSCVCVSCDEFGGLCLG